MSRRTGVFALLFWVLLMWGGVGTTSASNGLELEIPSLALDTPIVNLALTQQADGSYNWDTSRLRWKVGHLQGTAWFGEGGNIVLGGHSEWGRKRDIFYHLDQVQLGADINVHNGDQVILYRVAEVKVVEMTDVSVLYNQGGEKLTLITCDKTSRQRNGVYTRRVIVVANRV